ncbi:MAG: vWA domain-containing protein [Ktedonobacteraceae bacterium]
MVNTTLRLLTRYSAIILCTSIVLLASLTLPLPTLAQAHSARLNARPDDSAGHATIIVLDMSGSMGTNDPLGLRCSAANAYIDLSRVNDYVGVVGLDNNNGQTTGTHNFQTAQVWTQPLNTATLADKQNLKNIIANKSNACRPDNTTPTYNSLSNAYSMLAAITKQQHISGSVILLTDGTPYPDTDAQIADIKSDLVPQFQTQGWPIDTIGLGPDGLVGGSTPGTFHDFLKSVSNATGGSFYDDGNGPVPGVSPLNIAPFFLDIFHRYSGDTLRHDIPVTPLNGSTIQRNFPVTDGTNQLDVVVVKDQSGTTATLSDPNGQPVVADNVGVFVSQDKYHVIYQITQPQAGQWTVSVTGSGKFLMDDLHTSNIGLSSPIIALPNLAVNSTKNVFPLGQPLTVTTHLTQNQQPITDHTFTIGGTIFYASGASEYTQPFTLNDNAIPGTYVGTVTVPDSAPAGSYSVQLNASTISVQNVVSGVTENVRLEIFPTPYLLLNGQYVDTPVNATVIQWWWPLQHLYTLPVIDHLSGWPLQGWPADPHTSIAGEVQVRGTLYAGAQIEATAYNSQQKAFPVRIISDGLGHFTAQFDPPASGQYTIRFQTSGTYQDSQGSFGPTTRTILVTVNNPTLNQLLTAFGITLFYILLLIFFIYLIKFWGTPRPYGVWVYNPGGDSPSSRSFRRAHRGLFQWFFQRNHIKSRQAGMPVGLEFRFGYGKNIEVRPDKNTPARSKDWQVGGANQLRPAFQRVRELLYRPGGTDEMGNEMSARYLIETDENKGRRSDGSGGYRSDERGRSTKARTRNTRRNKAQPDYRSTRNTRKRGKQSSSRDYYGEY